MIWNIKDVPADVIWLKCAGTYGQMVGTQTYERIVRANPQHFPKEYINLIRWEIIPKEVHEEYAQERIEVLKDLNEERNNLCPSQGIIYWSDHPGKYTEWRKKWEEITEKQLPKRIKIERKIHKKYYSLWGIPFNKKTVI